MWKESYRLGVDLIDIQHMELFKMVSNLLEAVQNGKGDTRKECVAAITFLREYTLQHFNDEEKYQKSIGYEGLAEHKRIHQEFVRDVMNYERKMVKSGFSTKDVKDFMGMLIAWLVYHVTGVDQQIVARGKQEAAVKAQSHINNYFHISTCHILNKLTGLDVKSINAGKQAVGDLQATIAVQIDLSGDHSGTVTYNYTKQLAFDLMRNMASFTPVTIDELVCSAMLEISNIISVNAIGIMSSYGFSCNMDTRTMQVHPAFIPSKESIIFDTGMGILEIEVSMK